MRSLLTQAHNLRPGQHPGLQIWLFSQLRKLTVLGKEPQAPGPALSSDPALGRTGRRVPSPCLGSRPHGQGRQSLGYCWPLCLRLRPLSAHLSQLSWKQNKDPISWMPVPFCFPVSHQPVRCLVSWPPPRAAQQTHTRRGRAWATVFQLPPLCSPSAPGAPYT